MSGNEAERLMALIDVRLAEVFRWNLRDCGMTAGGAPNFVVAQVRLPCHVAPTVADGDSYLYALLYRSLYAPLYRSLYALLYGTCLLYTSDAADE